jgi:hypothetical protein
VSHGTASSLSYVFIAWTMTTIYFLSSITIISCNAGLLRGCNPE